MSDNTMTEAIEQLDPELVIDAKNLSRSYNEGDNTLRIFHDVEFTLIKGESVSILGTSGSGKTTLLNILGGLDKASSGSVTLCGKDLATCSEKVITKLRNQNLGFVYQFHHLLPEFSAVENVAMPLYIAGLSRKKADQKALTFLEKVGLTARANHKPSELSGGERQRVAIARALVNDPACVLMDEPTGNLDDTTAKKIQALMLELKEQLHTSFVVVTHDTQLAHKMDRVLIMEDGRLRTVS
ncbi:MAG: lipoprotein-releasing system ATP-binding protein [Oleiphilaceae bacterium]|jgi:lipoprotein-releasing system ATP-binding protein